MSGSPSPESPWNCALSRSEGSYERDWVQLITNLVFFFLSHVVPMTHFRQVAQQQSRIIIVLSNLPPLQIPGNMMLQASRPHEGLESLLHVYCSKQLSPDVPFFAKALIIGSPGVIKMKMSINYGVSINRDHPRPCPYSCCSNDMGFKILGGRVCGSCGRANEDLQRCPCKEVFYCDEVCQRRHWRAGHKRVCSARMPNTMPAH